MNTKKLLTLGLSILLIGCTNKKDIEPTSKPQTPKNKATKPPQTKVVQTAKPSTEIAIKPTKTTVNQKVTPKTVTNKINSFELLKEVNLILDSKTYNAKFEKKVQVLWPLLQKTRKKQLIDKILQTASLSKSYMGRKPYLLAQTLLNLQLNQEFTLYVLNALRHNKQPNLNVAKSYLTLRFNKNFGSNYYEWKQVIVNSN